MSAETSSCRCCGATDSDGSSSSDPCDCTSTVVYVGKTGSSGQQYHRYSGEDGNCHHAARCQRIHEKSLTTIPPAWRDGKRCSYCWSE